MIPETGVTTARTITLPSLSGTGVNQGHGQYEVEITQTVGTDIPSVVLYRFVLDTAAAAPVLSYHTPPASPSTTAMPTFTVTGENWAVVQLYTDQCSTATTGAATTIAGSSSVNIQIAALAVGPHTIYARQTDAAGNISPCSSGIAYERILLPSALPSVTAVAGDRKVVVSWDEPSAGENITGYEYQYANDTLPTAPNPSVYRHGYAPGGWDFTTTVLRAELAEREVRFRNAVGQNMNNFTFYACPYTFVNSASPNASCVTATKHLPYGRNDNNPRITFTPTQALLDNNGVVMIVWHTATHVTWYTEWIPFIFEYSDWANAPLSRISTANSRVSLTTTGLTNAVEYAFKVRGVNANGSGAASAEVRATPVAPVYSISSPAVDTAVNEVMNGTLAVTVTGSVLPLTGGDVLCTITGDSTGGRTATAHNDFYDTDTSAAFITAPTALASFTANDTTATCLFTVHNDTAYEPGEHFIVTLSSPSSGAIAGATYTNNTRRFTIPVNDITLGFQNATLSANEGDTPQYCVNITQPAAGTALPAGVSIVTQVSTTAGTAVAGDDYTALSHHALAALSHTNRSSCGTVSITDDSASELTESFTMTAAVSPAPPAGMLTVSPATTTVTITESDRTDPPAGAYTVSLAAVSDTNTNTDEVTMTNASLQFDISAADSHGGAGGPEHAYLYYKSGSTCPSLPSNFNATAVPSGWTQYGVKTLSRAAFSFQITGGSGALADGSYCFFAVYTSGVNRTALNSSRGSVVVTIDRDAPTISFTDNIAVGPVTSETVVISLSETATFDGFAYSADTTCNSSDSYTVNPTSSSGATRTLVISAEGTTATMYARKRLIPRAMSGIRPHP